MKVYVAEVTICDHPDYECFEGVYRTSEEAIKRAVAALEEEVNDCGEGEVTVHENSNGGWRVTIDWEDDDDCLSDWFIHAVEI